MKIVGLTGGIGSGKTTVANMFKKLGVPIYIADIEARKLTNTSKVIRKKMIALLGEEAYDKVGINKKYVANLIFNNKELLMSVNAIIHHKVAQHFEKWLNKQQGVYCIKEAAILFENGSYKNCDHIILVTAPEEIKIERVINRDKTTREEVLNRIHNQWTDEEKKIYSNTILQNTDLQTTQKKVNEIHLFLLKSLK
ncbi:MAG: dephospho-CoA kinase [Flavobacteriaceae bacterium]